MTVLQGIMFLFAAPVLLWLIPKVWFAIREAFDHPNVHLMRARWVSEEPPKTLAFLPPEETLDRYPYPLPPWHCFEPGVPCTPGNECSTACGYVTGVL